MASDGLAESHASVVETVPIPWRDGAPLTVEIRRGGKHTHDADDNAEIPQPPAASTRNISVVFVNGLGKPRAAWKEVAARLPASYTLLSYDRFGQGDTPHLPDGVPASWHDGAAAARDLYELICELGRRGERGFDPETARIVVVGHSIGAAIVRLLLAAGRYDGETKDSDVPQPARLDVTAAVQGALLLDPSIVNSDFVSLFPPPTEGEPPELTRTREATRRVFHPSVPNPEGFDRAAFLRLLPLAEKPVLPGHPYLTVVGHDPNVIFGEDAEKVSTFV
ncbi:hypothetical protein PFICI_06773 [Pestalotiopsis fici W106-1]|uniref:AB hydrolase-1 domain-containing protein n=1 Tax=Pestalotiopsis fici (strain W106-1 / CGMCC3.15140) TaxID=1229662 RepID=W3X9E2_PESFW|nr:uncharacterized protein PFICI_06773 [Pestalotiopsis fici W106-1]ETS81771.1 hypothetical protein PFICI_06773 [Pestalotiopsis fici W106-1]